MLSYESPASRVRVRARGARLFMLIVGMTAFVLGAGWLVIPILVDDGTFAGYGLMGSPVAPGMDNRWQYAAELSIYLGVFLLMQWLFLKPRGSWRLSLSISGRPLVRAALAAGFVGMLVSAGLVASVLEMGQHWEGAIRRFGLQGCLGAMGVLWLFWGAVIHLYWRKQDTQTGMGRVVRALLCGTILEVLVAAPAQAMRPSKYNCYCEKGSYTGLVFGCTAIVWLFGPVVFLMFLRERRRLERRG